MNTLDRLGIASYDALKAHGVREKIRELRGAGRAVLKELEPYLAPVTQRPQRVKTGANRGRKTKETASGYVGVYRDHRNSSRFRVVITVEDHQVFCGTYADEVTAAYAADVAMCDILGKNAKPNFGEPGYA